MFWYAQRGDFPSYPVQVTLAKEECVVSLEQKDTILPTDFNDGARFLPLIPTMGHESFN